MKNQDKKVRIYRRIIIIFKYDNIYNAFVFKWGVATSVHHLGVHRDPFFQNIGSYSCKLLENIFGI